MSGGQSEPWGRVDDNGAVFVRTPGGSEPEVKVGEWLAGDPAEVVIAPRLAHIGMLEFHRAGEAIAEGENCVRNALEEIRKVTGKTW